MTRLPKMKISWRRGKQYTSSVTLGGGINREKKIDVDPRWDDDASSDFALKNEGSMMKTCRNINVHVVTQIYVETYMNVYRLHKKADLSSCTA